MVETITINHVNIQIKQFIKQRKQSTKPQLNLQLNPCKQPKQIKINQTKANSKRQRKPTLQITSKTAKEQSTQSKLNQNSNSTQQSTQTQKVKSNQAIHHS